MSNTEKFLGSVGRDMAWQREGLCRDPKVMYLFGAPDRDGKEPTKDRQLRERGAKKVCNTPCPVRAECLAFALATNEPLGIWGGLNPRERRSLKRRRLSA